MYSRFIKRLLDMIMSLIGIVVLLPVFLVLVIAIRLDSEGPVLFRQKRVGRRKKLFSIYKFRTMRIDTPRDIPTHLLENPERYITRMGRFMRKASLDELPQIFNIFLGQMAVIGPRPALWNQDDLIAERDKYRGVNGWTPNDLRPGLSGWAQINGRDELEIPVKAALDGEYVRRMSFLFDVRCFAGTFLSVFRGRGVVEGGTGQLHKQAAQQQATPEDAAQKSSKP